MFSAVSAEAAEPSGESKKLDLSIIKIIMKESAGKPESKPAKVSPEKDKKKESPQGDPDIREIEQAAEKASQTTGVRKEFLMGMLIVESDAGKNTGGCTYQEVERGAEESYQKGQLSGQAWQTFQKRRETIREIAEDLGYDPDTLKVSCNPSLSVYHGTGGAMGVPQFMPDTWLEYKDRLSVIVGKEHPDPWDIQDGVMAMALKLSDVSGVLEHNRQAEKNAAKLYLSGTTSASYNWYAERIMYWAENYYHKMS